MAEKEFRLQTPITIETKKDLDKRASEIGLSANDVVRLLVNSFVNRHINIGVTQVDKQEEIEKLDSKTEARLKESMEAYEKGDYEVVDPFDRDALRKVLGLD